MSESTRRSLLQQTAIAAGAAALLGSELKAAANTEPAWPTLFPAGLRMSA